ncbi:hypothetical protein [Jannaschia donghaensis]|uniref:hypothetical protein n=1 Tax=Jannaschia donghaensis TaxID=420998 RepID=UPI0011873A04|nr:hypothetical protein [Jannaschia donghaensis]
MFLASIWTVGANAQATTVRSGEHATFSRLVFADDLGRRWTTKRTADGFEIEFFEDVPTLDLDQVFDLIPRNRLVAVESVGKTLQLSLGCDCPVVVSQIASGHIVIDIEDPDPARRNTPPIAIPAKAGGVIPFELAPRNTIFPILADLRDAPVPNATPSPVITAPNPIAAVPGDQFRRHPLGSVALVPQTKRQQPTQSSGTSCNIDALASETLVYDPKIALSELTTARNGLLSGQDILDDKAVERLARTYLRLGWGVEAAMTADLADFDTAGFLVIAAAFDGVPVDAEDQVDPGCGAGAAVVALLTGVDSKLWARANEADVVVLLDRMPASRWADLSSRLEIELSRLNRADLLTGLGPPENTGKNDTPIPSAAGTDLAAIRLAISHLAETNTVGLPPDRLHIENVRALRPSVPAGALRDELDAELAEALVLAGLAGAAAEMVSTGKITAEQMLGVIEKHAAGVDGVAFIVRLEPHLAPDDPARLRARSALLAVGLEDAAQRFAVLPDDRLPDIADAPIAPSEPWLARDFPALTAAPPDEWTARTRMADAILRRNDTGLPDGDLAAADEVLSRSRETGMLVRQLIDGL